MHFSELRLSPPILRAVQDEGYTTPTPIQAQTIPAIIDGRDVLGCAQTGTGKTAAFALPILHRLTTAEVDKTQRGPRKARVLVLSPTRELAAQIGASFATYGRHAGITHTVIFGGVSQHHQAKALQRGVDVIIATPGRLIDLMEQRIAFLDGIEVLVLDEADRMLDMGFIDPIRRIASATKKSGRQTLLFSATMPRTVAQLAASMLSDPVKVSVAPAASNALKIEQGVYMVKRDQKQPLLEQLLNEKGVDRVVVFTRTKHGADRVGRRLERAGVRVETIHGNKGQNQRTRALAKFSSGGAKVLVATDVAARGLDVDGITHVFNFDLPVEAEAYVHRIGRTGRAGASGIAISFCDGEERSLLREIQKFTGKQIPLIPTPEIQRSASADMPFEEERAPRPMHGPRSHGGAPRPSGAPRSPHAPARPSHGPRPAHSARTGHGPARPKTAWRGAKKATRR